MASSSVLPDLFVVLVCLTVFGNCGDMDLTANKCEEINTSTGQLEYLACLSALEKVFLTSKYTVTVTPAESTCGNPPEDYCNLNPVSLFCDICNASNPAKAHPPEDMHDFKNSEEPDVSTWWQSVSQSSPPLEVNITISLDKMYELYDDLDIYFKYARPKEVILEKSTDHGVTWSVLQYYTQDCDNYIRSGAGTEVTLENPQQVICSTKYTSTPPFDAVLSFPVLEERYALFLGPDMSQYSALFESFNRTNWNEFLQFTDLRIRLLTPAGNAQQQQLLQGFFYAISNIYLVARCSCNLHAPFCMYQNGETVCNCKHNTEGKSCERCLPLYNDRPWKPGFYLPAGTGTANECKKCTCYDHADSCHYDVNLKGGVCDNCQHNTAGTHCELCQLGYYRDFFKPLDDENVCLACNCEKLGVKNNNLTCSQSSVFNVPAGQCDCKDRVTGRRCNTCVEQFYGLLLNDNPGVCKACACNQAGTLGNSNVCDSHTGQCPCKATTTQRDCGQCKDGFYGFPSSRPSEDCYRCNCTLGGSLSTTCDKRSGQCPCRANINGLQCNQVLQSYYYKALDVNQIQPNGGDCTKSSALLNSGVFFTGREFRLCRSNGVVKFNGFSMEDKQENIKSSYLPSIRYSLEKGSVPASLSFSVTGSVSVDAPCPEGIGELIKMDLTLTAGPGLAWLASTPVSLDKRCRYSATLSLNGTVDGELLVDSLVLFPSMDQLEAYQLADDDVKQTYTQCLKRFAELSTKTAAQSDPDCQAMEFSIMAEVYAGAKACDCDPTGTVQGSICNPVGGQCVCKPGVFGRRCDMCEPGFYNLTESGCTACNCSSIGSASPVCNQITGQCPCKTNVAAAGQANNKDLIDDLQCRACVRNHFGILSGDGCKPCDCNVTGSADLQCDDGGVCPCKQTITGEKCDTCAAEHFNFTAGGCSACGCNTAGSTGPECDLFSGVCTCLSNVIGNKCETCQNGTFNLAASNPSGCQPCFCYGHGSSCDSADGYVRKETRVESPAGWTKGLFSFAAYLQAPANFFASIQTSYGQTLSMEVKSLGRKAFLKDGNILILEGSDRDKNVKRFLSRGEFTVSNTVYTTVTVHLYEDNFYPQGDPSGTVTAEELYDILRELDFMWLKTVYGGVSVDVKDINLVGAEPLSEDNQHMPLVRYMENCTCAWNTSTAGLSCEMCEQGNRRAAFEGNAYHSCQACECNGRTDTVIPICNETTGECLNCRNGTTGSDCSQCQQNVRGGQCDDCNSGYWGLGNNGCQACDCNADGAQFQFCDKITGQCFCKDHVTGRQCNECEENYHQLTAAGCTQCDDCYSLLVPEVELLRNMSANLTQYINDILSSEKNSELGSFSGRLQSTVDSMDRVLAYLSKAQAIEGPASSQLNDLNSTLNHLRSLYTGAEGDVNLANANVEAFQTYYLDINKTLDNITQTVADSHGTQQGHLLVAVNLMTAFVDGLKAVETSMQTLVQNGGQVIDQANSTVSFLERDTAAARTAAQDALQNLQYAIDQHQNTTQRVSQLQQFMTVVQSLQQTASSMTSQAKRNITDKLAEVVALRQNVTRIQDLNLGTQDLVARATQLKTEAQEINTMASEATIANQSMVQDVQDAENYTSTLTARVQDLSSQSQILLQQARDVASRATAAKTLESKTFTDAQQMLEIMKEFDVKADEVSKIANDALSQVQAVKSLSEQAINNAVNLRAQLQVTQSNAQEARELANQAKITMQNKEQALLSVQKEAVRLQQESGAMLTNLDLKVNNIDQINRTQIQSAVETCNNISPLLAVVQARVSTAEQRANSAQQTTTESSTRVQQALNNLNNIAQLDSNQIQNLKTEIENLASRFNEQQLTNLVQNLQKASQEQRSWIDAMKQRVESVRMQVNLLKQLSSEVIP